MSQHPVQIFLSYSWRDNQLPPGNDPWATTGFAKALYDSLIYDLDSADPSPHIWWDSDHIDEAEQFDPKILNAIQQSSYFLIILSRNWQESAYCQKELQLFRERWKNEEEFKFKHRIVLAHKTSVPEERRSNLLPVQRGLTFFSKGPHDALETSFFERGRGNTQFYFVARGLAKVLAKRAKFPPESKIWTEGANGGDTVVDVRGGLAKTINPSVGEAAAPNTRSSVMSAIPDADRKIYLAKPSADTQTDYLRVYKELTDRGFVVAPSPAGDFQIDESATQAVNEALTDALVSIHLVGKIPTPGTDLTGDVASFQLARAETRVVKQPSAEKGSAHPFRRIIWIPRVFEGAERNPIDSLRRFSAQLPSDRIEGDTISRFIESLLIYLDSRERPERPPSEPVEGAIYLCHDVPDEDFAFELANVLAEINQDCILPVSLHTSEQERVQFHKENLAKCSSVMLCWANGSEYWAKGQSMELADWRKLGRRQQFARRALIAGPPPDTRKEDRKLRVLFPPKEIDILLNWATSEKAVPEAIKDIFADGTNASP